jgi:hypothetical protein
MADIYVGFLTRVNGVFFTKREHFLDALIYFFAGPFTHCVLLLDTKQPCYRITINKKANMVLAGKKDLTKTQEGYSYIKISVTLAEYQKLQTLISGIVSHPTCFDLAECLGIKSYDAKVTVNKQAWFCSSLLAFLLREIGVLNKDIHCVKVSVTTLYLLLRTAGSKTRKVELLSINPITKTPCMNADQVYIDYKDIDIAEIPELNVQVLRSR